MTSRFGYTNIMNKIFCRRLDAETFLGNTCDPILMQRSQNLFKLSNCEQTNHRSHNSSLKLVSCCLYCKVLIRLQSWFDTKKLQNASQKVPTSEYSSKINQTFPEMKQYLVSFLKTKGKKFQKIFVFHFQNCSWFGSVTLLQKAPISDSKSNKINFNALLLFLMKGCNQMPFD